MENLKWKEIVSNKIKVFQLEDEPELIYLIKIREGEFMIVHEDGYDQYTGKLEFLNGPELKDKYGVVFSRKIFEAKATHNPKELAEFLSYIRKQRTEMAKVAIKYDTQNHRELRTEIDSLLIAYDQMHERLKNLNPQTIVTPRNTKPSCWGKMTWINKYPIGMEPPTSICNCRHGALKCKLLTRKSNRLKNI